MGRIPLGAHMIPCRECLAAPTYACTPDDARELHSIRISDVAMLNAQIGGIDDGKPDSTPAHADEVPV